MSKNKKFNTTWLQPVMPDNYNDPDHDLVYKRKSFNLPSIKTHVKNTCTVAWNSVVVDEKGRVFTCMCDGHVPFPVGKVHEFETFDQIFNSPQAILTQQSILRKEFEYCATKFCGVESADNLGYDECIFLGIQTDISCNLTCPSCRERLIFINDEEIIAEKHAQADQMFKWINNTDKFVIIEFAGGEPLASLTYLKMLELYSTNTRVRFRIRTNGSLLKTHLSKFDPSILKNIIMLSISIDAASKETYEVVRRGAKWEQLLENLEFAKNMGNQIDGNFVVQASNLDDVLPFVELCKTYNLTPTYWVVQDWGTWHDFDKQCVHLPSSPYYEKFKAIFNDPVFTEHNISLVAIKPWL